MARINAQVYIYRDSRTREYYGKAVRTTGGAALPEYSDASRAVIADALKSVRPDIAEFLTGDYKLPPEFINNEVAPAIAEYNSRHTGVTTTRWLAFNMQTREFRQINDKQTIASLERNGANLVDIGYGGDYDSVRMSEFTVSHMKNSKREYIVFMCDTCGKHGYGELVGGKAACTDCGSAVKAQSDAVKGKYGSIAEAAGAAARLNRGERSAEGERIRPQRFFYGDRMYGFGARDAESLHAKLYAEGATREIIKGDPPEGFTQKYEAYLYGLYVNRVMTELYDNMDGALVEARNMQASADDAFYMYFRENGLAATDALCRTAGGEHYRFDTPADYAKRLIGASGEEFAALYGLFDAPTVKYFLGGEYELDRIELSRLVYENTGRFVYFYENAAGKVEYTDFGTAFMRELHKFDKSVSARDAFLQEMIGDYRFWERVKGECDYADFYDPATDTYYDRLCFYAFAVGGKRTLKYKSLAIANSAAGADCIRGIVTNAYLHRAGASLSDYSELAELVKLPLLDKLDALCAVRVTGSDENFVSGLRARMSNCKDAPDTATYLFCVSVPDRREVKIFYDGTCDGVLAHAERTVRRASDAASATAAFLNNKDIATALEYIFGKAALDKNRERSREAFSALKATIQSIEGSGSAPKGRL